jgi:hypothetical protein
MKGALENISKRGVPQNSNMWPRIAERLEKRSPIIKVVSRRLAAAGLSVLLLLALTGVAYAIGNLWGYIPGIGIVNRTGHFLILAEPVSQSRNGVTITASAALVSDGKALVVFKTDGISADQFSPLESFNTCFDLTELHLSNGEVLKIRDGSSKPNIEKTGYESRYIFTPVTMDVRDATLFIPCILPSQIAGTLPGSWELPLRFEPATEELPMIPVVQLAPSPMAGSSSETEHGPFAVTKMIDTGDSYILIGEFDPPAPPQSGDWQSEMLNLTIVDASGRTVNWQPPFDIDLPVSNSPHKENWAVKFVKGFTPPFHITYTARYVYPSNSAETYSLEFDAGTNPLPGQEWKVDQEFQLAGHAIRLTSVTAGSSGYFFLFQTDDPDVNRLSAKIDGYTLIDDGGGVGVGGWSVYGFYSEIPRGKLKVILSDLYLNGETKQWTVDW